MAVKSEPVKAAVKARYDDGEGNFVALTKEKVEEVATFLLENKIFQFMYEGDFQLRRAAVVETTTDELLLNNVVVEPQTPTEVI